MGEINNFPGAAVPFGMVQYSPDTADNYAGYDHDNARSTGFSLTHASVGCAAFGDIPMLPTTTPIGSQPWYAWEKIAHDDTEVGVPGYYTVRFPDNGSDRGTDRHHPHRRRPVQIPGQRSARAVSRALRRVARGQLCGEHPDRRGQHHDHRIGDHRRILRQEQHLHGVLRDEVQPAVHLLRHLGRQLGLRRRAAARIRVTRVSGGYVEFPAGSVLEVQTALSYVSVDGARANLAAEGGASFDDVRAAASTRVERRRCRVSRWPAPIATM